MLRRFIPKEVRIGTFIVIIATFVTVADYLIQAISLEIHKALGAFLALIVVNCIILGRAEAFASKNTIAKSILDAIGSGIGFTLAIVCMGTIREILGNGSFAGIDLFGPSFEPWVIMILPCGGFFIFGTLMLGANIVNTRQRAKAKLGA